jgi:hypothetical protein
VLKSPRGQESNKLCGRWTKSGSGFRPSVSPGKAWLYKTYPKIGVAYALKVKRQYPKIETRRIRKMELLEYYHNTGKCPDWAYYQLNGKTAQENYNAIIANR